MGLYTGNDNWPNDVYQFETTDLVLGGPGGIDNKPLKELADRTVWLRNAQRGFADVNFVNRSAGAVKNLTLTDVSWQHILINAEYGLMECVLPVLSPDEAGVTVNMMAYNVDAQVKISSSAQNIVHNNDNLNTQFLYMGTSDTLRLMWTGQYWIVISFTGNFNQVGMLEYGYKKTINTIVADGSLIARSTYPRLWDLVQTLGASLISDFQWNSVPGNKGFFSTGNGTTTFRVPDLRAMFIRGLDLGAGISYGRNNENPGGYESDEFRSHDHDYIKPAANGSASGNAVSHPDGPLVGAKTSTTGGSETRPKNIGLIPLIKV